MPEGKSKHRLKHGDASLSRYSYTGGKFRRTELIFPYLKAEVMCGR